MRGTMTSAEMDVHARSTYAASLDVVTGELSRQRFDTGAVEPVVGWLAGLPGLVRACCEAGRCARCPRWLKRDQRAA